MKSVASTAVASDDPHHRDLVISALQALPDLLVLADSTGRVHYVSPSVTEVLGIPASRVIGRSIADHMASADARNLVSWITHADRGGELPDLTARLRRKDGSFVLTEVRVGGRVAGHFLLRGLSFRDISQRTRRAAAVHPTGKNLWGQVHERLTCGLVELDNGTVVRLNRAAAELFGITVDDALGHDIDELLHVIGSGGIARVMHQIEAVRRSTKLPTGDVTFVAEARRDNGGAGTLHVDAISAASTAGIDGGTDVVLLVTPVNETAAPHVAAVESQAALALWDALSPRERQVLRRLADGADVREISNALDISIHTARSYVKSILHKFGVRTQLQAVLLATRLGLLDVV